MNRIVNLIICDIIMSPSQNYVSRTSVILECEFYVENVCSILFVTMTSLEQVIYLFIYLFSQIEIVITSNFKS